MLISMIHMCGDLFNTRMLCANCVVSHVSCLPHPRGMEACHQFQLQFQSTTLDTSQPLWGVPPFYPVTWPDLSVAVEVVGLQA